MCSTCVGSFVNVFIVLIVWLNQALYKVLPRVNNRELWKEMKLESYWHRQSLSYIPGRRIVCIALSIRAVN